MEQQVEPDGRAEDFGQVAGGDGDLAALDYATPVSCLGTHQGAMRVNDVLTQIEHGVW